MSDPLENPELHMSLAKVTIASWAMQALGQEYEEAATQLADRIAAVIVRYTGGIKLGGEKLRLEALGRAVAESCQITLGLLAAVAPRKD